MCVLWEHCTALSTPLLFCAQLGHVVADEHMMAMMIEELCMGNPEEDKGREGAAFVSMLNSGICKQLHITVGTRDASMPPFEAGALVESFQNSEKGMESIRLEDMYVNRRIKGLLS
jgi:tRNA ligase